MPMPASYVLFTIAALLQKMCINGMLGAHTSQLLFQL